ncbi:hypothetical protein MNBD_ALPHA02-620 [hydrothermal vent metagenome]|uniref:Uncharacterized protein n=1 Tax=hydrothermal vent metagenome TaxID=652676 RepID=A0A3B0RHJ4_9ZZZZ
MNNTSHKEADGQDPWLRKLCEEYNEKHGRGWKRILASELGIHETNIQNWLRSGKVPAVIKALVERNKDLKNCDEEIRKLEDDLSKFKNSPIIISNNDGSFSVRYLDQKTGQYKSYDKDLTNAHKLAATLSGEIDVRINALIDGLALDDRFEDSRDKALIDNLINWFEPTAFEKEALKQETNVNELDKYIKDSLI